jgi:predicted Zn-dependent peptidase
MPAFERRTLPNGLRVLTATMPQAQSVSCFVMLAAGSRYETRESSGIAHFAEHMFFKGTERRPTARDIAGEVDAIGGEFNAFTGKEYTGYYVRCAAEHRDVALDVIVDMLRNSKFDADEIDREKGVIVEEMNMYFDTPRDFIDGVYEELVYGDDHPLGWDIIGRKETIQDANRQSFLDYIGHWYKPSRMVFGVGGRTGDGLIERITELVGNLEDAPTGAPLAAPTEAANGSRVKVHTKQSDQAHICLGVRSRPITDPDRYVLSVLSTVLGGGMSSRLRVLRLRHEPRLHRRGLAVRAGGSGHRPDRRCGRDRGRRAAQDRGGVSSARGAPQGEELREGTVRAPNRKPAWADLVRPAPRGPRRADTGAAGGPRRDRRGDQ